MSLKYFPGSSVHQELATSHVFDAFISYNRNDVDFARRLEARLERYKRTGGEGHNRRLQIFRDEQDMVGSDYCKSIEEQLANSDKLILICSPAAANSQHLMTLLQSSFSASTSYRNAEHQ